MDACGFALAVAGCHETACAEVCGVGTSSVSNTFPVAGGAQIVESAPLQGGMGVCDRNLLSWRVRPVSESVNGL